MLAGRFRNVRIDLFGSYLRLVTFKDESLFLLTLTRALCKSAMWVRVRKVLGVFLGFLTGFLTFKSLVYKGKKVML